MAKTKQRVSLPSVYEHSQTEDVDFVNRFTAKRTPINVLLVDSTFVACFVGFAIVNINQSPKNGGNLVCGTTFGVLTATYSRWMPMVGKVSLRHRAIGASGRKIMTS